VELLRLREDRVVCAVCCALRNLALDQVIAKHFVKCDQKDPNQVIGTPYYPSLISSPKLQTNLELVGKYALPELLVKIPDGPTLEILRQQPSLAAEQPSDATLGAILGILWEAVRHSAELTRGVHQTAEVKNIGKPCSLIKYLILPQGTERLRALAKAYPIYGRRVCKYATQVDIIRI
jgi:hypothetical protein